MLFLLQRGGMEMLQCKISYSSCDPRYRHGPGDKQMVDQVLGGRRRHAARQTHHFQFHTVE